ncbi:MAG: bifunctional non-ous end joining protein LigD [Clostridia bacterium]|jgi:bifunctional non-homologous end joining protein LigD|nr:bifunctional non-ous end joining protein LigD [Clostridia bacterium]MDN5322982.1 bifunctional non-ous end joining protein LigD [Clostridia bacterium]
MQLKPIIPFEPVSTDTIPSGENWIAQIKWDGVRVLTYYDGHNVKLYNRKINERTDHYPELTKIKSYCKANSVILDGEIIALDSDGRPSFNEIMRRDAIKQMERVKDIRKKVKITYMVFDVVYCNGNWLDEWSLKERNELLTNILIPGEYVQLVSTHHDAITLFNVIKQYQMEGILIKDLNSRYYINGKNDRWQKKKFYRDLVAVVGGVTLRGRIVNALLLGLYDKKGQLWYIGHAGTGKLKHSDWKKLTERVKPLVTNQRPFINKPQRINKAIWLRPELTAKIQFAEWTKGKVLRQPSIQAFVELSPEECIFIEE